MSSAQAPLDSVLLLHLSRGDLHSRVMGPLFMPLLRMQTSSSQGFVSCFHEKLFPTFILLRALQVDPPAPAWGLSARLTVTSRFSSSRRKSPSKAQTVHHLRSHSALSRAAPSPRKHRVKCNPPFLRASRVPGVMCAILPRMIFPSAEIVLDD